MRRRSRWTSTRRTGPRATDYNKPLQPGERTPYLFTEVRFAAEMDARYGGAQVEVRVQAEATQAANNGQSALEAAGWPAAEQGE